ncbi:unnamed protein product [Sphenostylis stenocarpa]|uniref:Uncharacterized protein n=1 Tax=Sphenostylis stenocarpa TaxID=92480 RepID=A0AA87BAB6_9FABA|nr:unnamed protein product [Sphenostylis stenocarpa]
MHAMASKQYEVSDNVLHFLLGCDRVHDTCDATAVAAAATATEDTPPHTHLHFDTVFVGKRKSSIEGGSNKLNQLLFVIASSYMQSNNALSKKLSTNDRKEKISFPKKLSTQNKGRSVVNSVCNIVNLLVEVRVLIVLMNGTVCSV